MKHEQLKLGDSPCKAKQRISDDVRQRVLDLRRSHSLREVAAMTGLSLGTVKTLVSRSGKFRDNSKHRELFSLPPIRESEETLPSVPEVPPQENITGDREVDAVLWLRKVIATGEASLISTALEAAKKIEVPLKELEVRYGKYLMESSAGNVLAGLGSIGFADLEDLATRSIERKRLQVEAFARFGDALWQDTPAEVFCIEALAGLKPSRGWPVYDEMAVAERFKARPELMPHTLADCLRELSYWDRLYNLRWAVDRDCGDLAEVESRSGFVFALMAEIRPRDRAEAKAVLRYLIEGERKGWTNADAILENLIG
ncbi:hypothetical protein [Pseudomonas knackmussii]|uniref:hypothetical protein n=1 Tax=Pseudomonas knackmussii TaxID=65741 RepID=UPI003F4A37FA